MRKKLSFKSNLVITMVLSSLIPLTLIGILSYSTFYSISINVVDNSIQSYLDQMSKKLDNTLSNIDYTSQRFAFDEEFGRKLSNFLQEDSVYGKYELKKEMTNNMNLVSNTNPTVGLMFYYFPNSNNKVWFENYDVNPSLNLKLYKSIAKDNDITYHGPHKSNITNSRDMVFSVIRKVNTYTYSKEDCYVYIETNPNFYNSFIDTNAYGLKVEQILINSAGIIIYSNLKGELATGQHYSQKENSAKKSLDKGYYMFHAKGSIGYTMIAAIDKKAYNKELYQWIVKYAFFSTLSIIISCIFAVLIWRKMYKPIKNINKEIRLISEGNFQSNIKQTGVLEFDDVLNRFQFMKERVANLLDEIEVKEKIRSELEIEKLLAQINPHFLYNTLNTIQWLAKMNGQEDIERVATLLYRVLNYNLSKEGNIVKLKDEINIIKDYVELQKIRYDNDIDIIIVSDDNILDFDVPRFILEPLVENAIYHGLQGENGVIKIIINNNEDKGIIIIVEDNGVGMNEEEVNRLLLGNEGKKVGIGIGMNYVSSMIQVYFGEKADILIDSRLGVGTKIILKLPYN